MKKAVVLLTMLLFAKSLLLANVSKIDSLKTLIQSAKSDTDKVALQVKLFYYLYPENKEAGKNLYSSLSVSIPKLSSKKHQIKSYYKLAENKGKVSISEQELSNGVYFIQLQTPYHTQTAKFIKQ